MSDVDIHAWVSQAYILSTGNNYLARSTEGSFELFEAGINFSKQLDDRLRIGLQLFAYDLGSAGNYAPAVAWAFLEYAALPWLKLRAGRFKLPWGLYGELLDVDAARTAAILPQSFYDLYQRDFIQGFAGAEAIVNLDLGRAGELEAIAYGGVTDIPLRYGDIKMDSAWGGRLLWDTPLPCLRLGASGILTTLRQRITLPPGAVAALTAAGAVPPGWDGQVLLTMDPWRMWALSAQCAYGPLVATVEYSRWNGDDELDPAIGGLIPLPKIRRERAYAMVEYRLSDLLATGAYLSVFHPDHGDRDGNDAAGDDPASHQRDLAVTARFDLTDSWLVKVEGHLVDGAALVRSSEQGTMPLEERWYYGVAKTTLAF